MEDIFFFYQLLMNKFEYIMQLGVILGLFLAVILGVCLQFISRLFTEDGLVLQFIQTGIPVLVTVNLNK